MYFVKKLTINSKENLFLCTHNIEGLVGGDGIKIYLFHDPKHKNEEKPFRVLAEINKNDTWIKENDEFKENQVTFKLVFIEDEQLCMHTSFEDLRTWMKINPNPTQLKVMCEIWKK